MFTKSVRFYDAIYSWKDYKAESTKLQDLIQQHKQTDGSNLLDVACGTGGHIPYLSEHYTIEGLDLDEEMLNIAQQQHPQVTFHHGNMMDFDLGKQYDVITCLFGSIGYLPNIKALNNTITNFKHHLKPGGVILMEPWLTPDKFENDKRISMLTVDEADMKICRMTHVVIEKKQSILHMNYLVGTPSNGVQHLAEQHDMTLFTHDEYRTAFEQTGLETIYDEDSLMGRGLYISKPQLGVQYCRHG